MSEQVTIKDLLRAINWAREKHHQVELNIMDECFITCDAMGNPIGIRMTENMRERIMFIMQTNAGRQLNSRMVPESFEFTSFCGIPIFKTRYLSREDLK